MCFFFSLAAVLFGKNNKANYLCFFSPFVVTNERVHFSVEHATYKMQQALLITWASVMLTDCFRFLLLRRVLFTLRKWGAHQIYDWLKGKIASIDANVGKKSRSIAMAAAGSLLIYKKWREFIDSQFSFIIRKDLSISVKAFKSKLNTVRLFREI